jgi:hypothetical protein
MSMLDTAVHSLPFIGALLLHAATMEARCTDRPHLLAATVLMPSCTTHGMAPCRLQSSLRTGYERAWQRHFQNVLDATEVARQALNLTDVREQVGARWCDAWRPGNARCAQRTTEW